MKKFITVIAVLGVLLVYLISESASVPQSFPMLMSIQESIQGIPNSRIVIGIALLIVGIVYGRVFRGRADTLVKNLTNDNAQLKDELDKAKLQIIDLTDLAVSKAPGDTNDKKAVPILSKKIAEIPLPYKLNESLLTERENNFFRILRPVADKYNLYIAVKPRMADFIDNLGSKYSFYRISQKHVDFLLCDNDMKPIMALELDDSTHEREDRKERDEFVSKVYKEIGLKLVQILEYNDVILDRHLMLAKMNCEKCGNFLVLRQNRKDKSYFAGCSGFPKCDMKGMNMRTAEQIYKSTIIDEVERDLQVEKTS